MLLARMKASTATTSNNNNTQQREIMAYKCIQNNVVYTRKCIHNKRVPPSLSNHTCVLHTRGIKYFVLA